MRNKNIPMMTYAIYSFDIHTWRAFWLSQATSLDRRERARIETHMSDLTTHVCSAMFGIA